jgi:hypothetical protein
MKETKGFWIIGAAVICGLLFWQIPKELGAMRQEHKRLLLSNQVSCVHNAKTKQEALECVTLEIDLERYGLGGQKIQNSPVR